MGAAVVRLCLALPASSGRRAGAWRAANPFDRRCSYDGDRRPGRCPLPAWSWKKLTPAAIRLFAAAICGLAASLGGFAQDAAGVVTGRVANAATGAYLHNAKHGKALPNYSFEFSDTFLDGRLGVVAALNHTGTYVEQNILIGTGRTFDRNPTNNDTEIPALTQWNFQDGLKPTWRDAMLLNLDYNASERLILSLRTSFNYYQAPFHNRNWILNANRGTITANADDTRPEDGELFGLTGGGDGIPKNVFNTGFSYRQGRFNGQVKLNWVDERLIGITRINLSADGVITPATGNNSYRLDFRGSKVQVDVNISYEVRREAVVFLNVSNLFNESDTRYFHSLRNLSRDGAFGAKVTLGVKGTF